MAITKSQPQTLKLKRTQELVVANCIFAKSMISRMVGLLNHSVLHENEGMLITKCNQVHTLFMKFPIDAVFLDKNLKVIEIKKLPPWRISPIVWGSKNVLEIPLGKSQKIGLQVGDELEVAIC